MKKKLKKQIMKIFKENKTKRQIKNQKTNYFLVHENSIVALWILWAFFRIVLDTIEQRREPERHRLDQLADLGMANTAMERGAAV